MPREASGTTVILLDVEMTFRDEEERDRERGLNVDAANLSGFAASRLNRSPD